MRTTMKLTKKAERLLAATPGLSPHKGKLRLAFRLPGEKNQTKRSLGLDPTEANILYASNLLGAIKQDIAFGRYSADPQAFWEKHFPGRVKVAAPYSPTVNDAMADYADGAITQQTPRTTNSMNSAFRRLGAYIGDLPVTELYVSRLRELQKELLKGDPENNQKRMQPKSINDYFGFLSLALEHCCDKLREEHGMEVSNPCNRVKKLKVPKRFVVQDDAEGAMDAEVMPFSQEEFARILRACPTPEDVRLLTFMVTTGMRPGEVAALSWEDVDLVEGKVRVRLNLTIEKQLKIPKTNSGRRTVNLVPDAVRVLEEQQAQTKMLAPLPDTIWEGYQQTSIQYRRRVFPRIGGPHHGQPPITSPRIYSGYRWASILRKAGVIQRPLYQLRHTYASWSLMAGDNPLWLATQMGHKDWGMIRKTYGKWIPSPEGEVTGKLTLNSEEFDPYLTPSPKANKS